MPMKNMGKPNTSSNFKTSSKLMNISRAGAQKPGRVGQVATNNKIVSARGGSAPKAAGMKRGKKMY